MANKVTKAEWEATRVHDPARQAGSDLPPDVVVAEGGGRCGFCGNELEQGQHVRNRADHWFHFPCPPPPPT